MQINDIVKLCNIEKLCNFARETGYKQAQADALRAVIDTLPFYENDAMCRVCLTVVGEKIASLNESAERD